jgi:predicted  nucleic acid-binding Zn-ribbon protein
MKEHLERLIALQEADLRLEDIAERKRRIPEMVEAVRQPLLTAQATRDSLKQEVDKLAKDRKSCEQDLAEQEQAISKLQGRTTKGEIKTNREYQAHLVEIELAKKKKGEIEEQLLILMDQVDTRKKDLAQAEAAVKEADKRFAAEKASLEGSVGALDEEMAALKQKRETMVAAIEPTLLRTYEKLRANKKGHALAGVNKDGSCMACRLQVQPQVVAEVKRGISILTCSNCQRILYWTGEPVQIVPQPERKVEEIPVEETAETTE